MLMQVERSEIPYFSREVPLLPLWDGDGRQLGGAGRLGAESIFTTAKNLWTTSG